MLNLILPPKYYKSMPFSHIRLYFINTMHLISVIGNCMLGCIERPHLHADIGYLIIFFKAAIYLIFESDYVKIILLYYSDCFCSMLRFQTENAGSHNALCKCVINEQTIISATNLLFLFYTAKIEYKNDILFLFL